MTRRAYRLLAAAALPALAACSNPDPQPEAADTVATAAPAADSGAQTAVASTAGHCAPTAPVADRASPYDSTTVAVGGQQALVCYSRPSARGRTVFGGLVPYGKLWRTGANEPTIIHLPVAATIAGIAVQPGSYSIYTIPGESEWTVIVNRSTSQWGIESQYTPEVEAQEVGRATVPATHTDAPVEQFTIRADPSGNGSDLVLEWENTRVAIPIRQG
jgi:hypothetical protein